MGSRLTISAAAKLLGVSRRSLYQWTKENRGPPRFRMGKRYYYTEEMLKQWFTAQRLA
jgi:excisionase family DNA binding protein